jgi:peptide-methionine (R)-S-oxide reductase
MKRAAILALTIVSLWMQACTMQGARISQSGAVQEDSNMTKMVHRSEEEWKDLLTPMQYHILREKGTERPYTGQFDKFYEAGMYHCAACGQALFASDTKFDSGCGWPAFFAPLIDNNLNISLDRSHGMLREEVTCARCGGHLGHVFNDGPPPTYRRYCINSEGMKFTPASGDSLSEP